MKLRTLCWLMSLACLGLFACEDEAEPAADEVGADAAAEGGEKPSEPEAEPVAPEPGPADACNALVEAAKAPDMEKIKAGATEGSAEKLGDEATGAALATWLASATCGEAAVEGEAATIPLTAGEESREAAFAKTADGWKWDAAAFAESYPPPAPEKGKKGKKKKGKKKKGKKKRKKKK